MSGWAIGGMAFAATVMPPWALLVIALDVSAIWSLTRRGAVRA